MRSSMLLGVVLLLLAGAASAQAPAGELMVQGAPAGEQMVQGARVNFAAQLTGNKQIPALNTAASGMWEGTLDASGSTLSWTLAVQDVDSMTMAHIHQGDAKTNGPVVVWLVPRETPQEAQAAGGLPMLKSPVSGTQRFNGTFSTSDIGGPLTGKTLADLVDMMRAGTVYVNVHTTKNPGGEVRGQISVA